MTVTVVLWGVVLIIQPLKYVRCIIENYSLTRKLTEELAKRSSVNRKIVFTALRAFIM